MDKYVTASGTVEMTLAGDEISAVWKEVGDGKISWKPNRAQYSVTLWSDLETYIQEKITPGYNRLPGAAVFLLQHNVMF